jgi:hypothetical protein
MAKLDTGGQLAALITRLQEDLPKYANNWGYPESYPGFVEDAAQMIETVGALLQEEQVWGAYDEYHRFMNRWENVLHLPLWAQVGTVIVEGPGPTVESIYGPMAGLAREYQPEMHKVMDFEWELRKTLLSFWKEVALDVWDEIGKAGRPPVPIEEILEVVQKIAYGLDKDVRKPELMDHWAKLVKQEALQHYGLET